jgi:hypothetical protein
MCTLKLLKLSLDTSDCAHLFLFRSGDGSLRSRAWCSSEIWKQKRPHHPRLGVEVDDHVRASSWEAGLDVGGRRSNRQEIRAPVFPRRCAANPEATPSAPATPSQTHYHCDSSSCKLAKPKQGTELPRGFLLLIFFLLCT